MPHLNTKKGLSNWF